MGLSGLLFHIFEVAMLVVGVVSWTVVSTNQAGWKGETKEYAKANYFECLARSYRTDSSFGEPTSTISRLPM